MASTTGSEVALGDLNRPFGYDENDEIRIEGRVSQSQRHHHDVQHSLPAVDGGKEAWLFLAGSFFIEALVWGTCVPRKRL